MQLLFDNGEGCNFCERVVRHDVGELFLPWLARRGRSPAEHVAYEFMEIEKFWKKAVEKSA